jgi:DNA helicase II / ATP-dependent DNA helicase PcrA
VSGHWEDIRRLAIAFRRELAIPQTPLAHARDVLTAALHQEGLTACALAPSHPLLAGAQAVFDPESHRIWYDNTLDDATVQLVLAHEVGHSRLHGDRAACTAAQAIRSGLDGASTSGLAVVEGYGPEARQEHEANLFARELLLPASAARTAFIADGLGLTDFVKATGLPEPVLAQHLVYSVLVSDLIDVNEAKLFKTEASEPSLDQSQAKAAAAEGPLLVVAGPGTGKTRALVGRVTHLLGEGVAPSSILALTYSNKAAEEMRSRVAAVSPEAAVQMWIGTFHAFGLDVLRRFGNRIGIPVDPEVLSQVDGLALLEKDLNSLGLNQYLNLWDPTRALRDILTAISRAKDELIAPERYRELAEAMLAKAVDEQQHQDALQALEVAGVYAHYDAEVRARGAVDFGDLIARSVEVLRHQDGVALTELRAQFRHILVDEFQDVNHASAVLLQQLAGDGKGVWAVGDVRQSVYRFRGADPPNVRDFPKLFPGATVTSLSTNYRAQPSIVATYAAFAPQMEATAGHPFESWKVSRPDANAEVLVRVADDGDAEGDGIAKEAQRLAARTDDPIPLRNQAILCRSHLMLERIARRLERAGIPVLYLGDIFEREEVRDLLSLIALACEPDGRALIRVARFATYAIPLVDALALIRTAKERNLPFPQALELANDPSVKLSADGASGVNKLKRDIDGLCYGKSAWSLLSGYLLDRSDYLASLLEATSLAARQQRLAIYQFLQFALEQLEVQRIARPENQWKDPKRIFLDFVRRLAVYGDERQLRQVPDWANGLDAVRLMTIHGSKGLEFRAVFIPYLGARYMPSPRRPVICKPPVGMLLNEENAHAQEEECLFFVALSRAMDALCLSRASRYGKQTSNASRLLEAIQPSLACGDADSAEWAASPVTENHEQASALSPREDFDAKSLDVYIKCPRKYFYESVLGIPDRASGSAYVGFHRVVYEVLRWLREGRTAGRTITSNEVELYLQETWLRIGPHQHPYAPLYEAAAKSLIARARSRLDDGSGELLQPAWTIPLEHGRVSVTPEHVEVLAPTVDGAPRLRIRRTRTGRPTKSEHSKEIYGLYFAAARAHHPDHVPEIETLFLSTDEVAPVALDPKKAKSRLVKYDKAMLGIRSGAFDAVPSDRQCPRCPHFFICSVAEDGSSPTVPADPTPT